MTNARDKFSSVASKKENAGFLIGARTSTANIGKKDKMKQAVDKLATQIAELVEAEGRKKDVKITSRNATAGIVCVDCDKTFADKIANLPSAKWVRPSGVDVKPKSPKPSR